MKTDILPPTQAGIQIAANGLSKGALIAFPTETVYGLGADARNGDAVARIYAAKGRPSFNPLIVHVANVDAAKIYVEWSPTAQQLATAFWPGPLSLVLPLKDGHGLSSLVTAGLDTVAIRVPAHPLAQKLLAAFGGPVAAPSANPSGRISPTTATHVLDGLDGQITAVLDGGPCPVGVESTIVGLGRDTALLLRSGGVSEERLADVLGGALASVSSAEIIAPGQLASHYAPRAQVRLNAQAVQEDEVMLGFGTIDGTFNLSPSGDVVEAAANLFDMLHRLDAMARPIAVAPIPQIGLGVAINDRLHRAAAPR